MFLYKITQEEDLGKYGIEKESVMLCHDEKYDQYEFEELLRGIRGYLRKHERYVEIEYIVRELIPYGFKKIGFTAEDEFVLENYWV
ncbi:hypothetical protein [Tenuibacillus multivorans]|uniref:Uncharacterized protein n=1 Tax=Tenuibacillus multivorans TaxID=237069 RepID=A0A1H0CGB0_9BACI|nr:hypothetical protein [Tenuibacillus multivorans]GEL76309.1 hypothetical protein TMU01_05440 [Tenuibacillus multivorans]SDN56811.1 hypothetical protein SAMN05216498_2525 [Tenuibacillus multivorans]